MIQGCGIRPPITQFQSVSLTESTPEAVALQVEFEIANTNDEPIQLKYYNYSVKGGGATLYRGKAVAWQTVPRWSTITSSIPIVVRRADVQGANLVSWQLSGSISYSPPTAIAKTLMNTGLWNPTASIHAYGDVAIPYEMLLTE